MRRQRVGQDAHLHAARDELAQVVDERARRE
jgi:hypothetical protein